MEEKSFKKYIVLWLSQSVSGLGSSMTGFALVLWAYEPFCNVRFPDVFL